LLSRRISDKTISIISSHFIKAKLSMNSLARKYNKKLLENETE
jgi:hypothetical protein